jgi:hypothetical protein
MSTPASPEPDRFPIELLAAYADGELDPETRSAVERWLRNHPGALDELAAQRELSPRNASLWDRAAPPEPTEQAWATVRQGVANALGSSGGDAGQPRWGRGWRVAAWLLSGLSAAGVAAAVAWVALKPVGLPPRVEHRPPVEVVQRPPVSPEIAPPPRSRLTAPAPRVVDPLAGLSVLSIATDDDVLLERVPEFPTGWLPVGRHPLSGALILATEEELLLAGVEPSPAWPLGGPKMVTAPGDAPMIFATKPR